MAKTISFKINLPEGVDEGLEDTLKDMTRNIELAFKVSLASRIIEKRGMKKRQGMLMAEEVKKGVAKRLSL
jgi:hypothetical protein